MLERAILPLVIGLNALGNGLLRLVGIHRQEVETERYHTAEELQFIVQESQEGGLLRGESGTILRELFEFGDLTAGEIDGAARACSSAFPVGAEPDELRAIVRATARTRATRSTPATSTTSSAACTSRTCCATCVSNRTVTARDARPVPYVPGRRRSMRCSRRCAAHARRWPW